MLFQYGLVRIFVPVTFANLVATALFAPAREKVYWEMA